MTVPNDPPAASLAAAVSMGPPEAVAVDQARTAWATASRDTELSRWKELYDLAVPRPRAYEAARPEPEAGQ